jgi:hypothetical protein
MAAFGALALDGGTSATFTLNARKGRGGVMTVGYRLTVSASVIRIELRGGRPAQWVSRQLEVVYRGLPTIDFSESVPETQPESVAVVRNWCAVERSPRARTGRVFPALREGGPPQSLREGQVSRNTPKWTRGSCVESGGLIVDAWQG